MAVDPKVASSVDIRISDCVATVARHPELGERRANGIREIMTDAHYRQHQKAPKFLINVCSKGGQIRISARSESSS